MVSAVLITHSHEQLSRTKHYTEDISNVSNVSNTAAIQMIITVTSIFITRPIRYILRIVSHFQKKIVVN